MPEMVLLQVCRNLSPRLELLARREGESFKGPSLSERELLPRREVEYSCRWGWTLMLAIENRPCRRKLLARREAECTCRWVQGAER